MDRNVRVDRSERVALFASLSLSPSSSETPLSELTLARGQDANPLLKKPPRLERNLSSLHREPGHSGDLESLAPSRQSVRCAHRTGQLPSVAGVPSPDGSRRERTVRYLSSG